MPTKRQSLDFTSLLHKSGGTANDSCILWDVEINVIKWRKDPSLWVCLFWIIDKVKLREQISVMENTKLCSSWSLKWPQVESCHFYGYSNGLLTTLLCFVQLLGLQFTVVQTRRNVDSERTPSLRNFKVSWMSENINFLATLRKSQCFLKIII